MVVFLNVNVTWVSIAYYNKGKEPTLKLSYPNTFHSVDTRLRPFLTDEKK